MTIRMDNGDEIVVTWKPTEQGYADAEKYDDESCMCDWDDIAEVHYGLLHDYYVAHKDEDD